MNSGPLWIMLTCLGLGALLSALSACLAEMSRAALEELAEKHKSITGSRTASARRILADVAGHARAVSLARIVCNLGVPVAAVFIVASVRHRDASIDLRDALIGVAASAALLWAFNVALSESIARHAAARFVYTFGPVARAVYLLQRPLAPVARAIDLVIGKIAGGQKITKEEAVAEELMSVVEEGQREGAIDVDERRMIEAVVNFKNKTVEQISTPRNEIEALEYTNNLGEITAFVRKVRHSRVPVYRSGGGLDDVIGFFYVKDLLRWLAGETPKAGGSSQSGADSARSAAGSGPRGFELKTILRTALHVPDSKTVRELADEFVAKKVHVAVVVDEYGATTGLVTLEDIIEEVFGDIQDEYENKAEDAPPRIEVKSDDRLADIDARAYIDDANEALQEIGAKLPEADEYDTVGGFVVSTLGHMPEVNETFSHGEMTVTVLETSPTRVLKVRVQVRGDDAAMNGEVEKGK